MSKRMLLAGALIAVVAPLIGRGLLRTRAVAPAAPQAASTPAVASSKPLPEPIADLERRIKSGEVKLHRDEDLGYLRSLLKELHILPSSQTLVFGKNSAQLFLISPETPRALYFNDDVYVGYVQGAPHLEIASIDPVTGPEF